MKQKLINNILYVFSVEPYEITDDVDNADIIKVQLETLDDYIELNPDLTGKLTPYNYHLLTVNKQEWSDYVDAEEPVTKYMIKTYPTANVDIAGYVSPGEVTWLDKAQIWKDDVVGGEQIGQFASYEAGLPFQIDERYYGIISATPELSLSEDELWNVGTSYIMPDSDVELQLFEMPSENTEFNFTGYATEESSEPSSTGTVTYKGMWSGSPEADLPTNTKYVYGIANGHFADETLIEETPVFIRTEDVYPLLNGERVEVKTLVPDSTETIKFGYGEFSI